ncbi:hypothetical protein JCM6882_001703 [Rhodosporidiobolus microsporus]
MLVRAALALSALALSTQGLPSAPQFPFGLPGGPTSLAPSAFESFVKHFSAPAAATAVYLSETIRSLHSNSSSFATTQDFSFSLPAFAAEPANGMHLRERGSKIADKVYLPPQRRRDGAGGIGEALTWSEWDVDFAQKQWKVITAEWAEGFRTMRQSHLIGITASEEDTDLLLLAVSSYTTAIREAILVFSDSTWTADHGLWKSVQKASWDDVILDDELKGQIQREYRRFLASEEVYKDLGVPWKRGLILLGPPGNGKTISLKAMMHDSGAPSLYVKSLKTWMGEEAGIRMVFNRARAEAPCLLIFEDLDALITDENRSFFLNELDGLEENDGHLIIATTNHFDKLDPALSNRPSRFDRKYNFPNPSTSERRSYARYWQKKLASNDEIDFPDSLLDRFAEETAKFSFAMMKEAFVASLLIIAGEEGERSPFEKVLLEQVHSLRQKAPEELV